MLGAASGFPARVSDFSPPSYSGLTAGVDSERMTDRARIVLAAGITVLVLAALSIAGLATRHDGPAGTTVTRTSVPAERSVAVTDAPVQVAPRVDDHADDDRFEAEEWEDDDD
jgi:hypothetical protein